MSGILQSLVERVLGLFGDDTPTFEDNPAAEQAAHDAAERWLALVDDGAYAESWEQAAPQFQRAVPKDDWTQKASGVRDPLGAVRERTMRSARYATSLPGAPDGHYVVMQFDTRFESKAETVETVTFAKPNADRPESDADAWHATGYYVK